MAFLNALARAAKATGMRPDENLCSFSDKWKHESNAQSSLTKDNKQLIVPPLNLNDGATIYGA